MPIINDTVYSDIPINLNMHPTTGNILRRTNAEAVKNSVKNLVLTNFYERPYSPFLGGDLVSQLFENMDSITAFNISKNIRQVLRNYEPRAIIDDVRVLSNIDQNAIEITIVFRIKNDKNPITVTTFLERIR